uniref:Uncharacterized protein n=1 Tax=Tanacetum cinerariifolium TaxID=118510 RepID=A0A6L2LJL4_TANCI|nr:hypothetical protein [Tanacetum cinerariifolium]
MLWKLTQEAIVWALNLHIRRIAPTQVQLDILSIFLGHLILEEMIPRAQVNLNQIMAQSGRGAIQFLTTLRSIIITNEEDGVKVDDSTYYCGLPLGADFYFDGLATNATCCCCGSADAVEVKTLNNFENNSFVKEKLVTMLRQKTLNVDNEVQLDILSIFLGHLILEEMIPRAQVNLNQIMAQSGRGAIQFLTSIFLWRFNGRDWKLKHCSNGQKGISCSVTMSKDMKIITRNRIRL